jgi:uncharacterized protein (TIGR00369 family)
VTTERPAVARARDGHAYCLMCGHRNPRSLGLHFSAGEGTMVHARFRPDRSLQGYRGMLHGGMIAALLDAAMTHCLFRRGIQTVTADLHVRFLHPIRFGSMIDVRGWVVSESRRLYRAKSEIVLGRQVMAWGEATFMPRETPDRGFSS